MAMLTTRRLVLREMTDADLDDIAALLGVRAADAPLPAAEDPGGSAGLGSTGTRPSYHEHGFGLWLVALAETGEFVGDCGLTVQQVDGWPKLRWDITSRTDLQGLGYATEAATAARDFARDSSGLQRLIAIIKPEKHAIAAGRGEDRDCSQRNAASSSARNASSSPAPL